MWRALKAWLNPPPPSATVGTITDLAGHIQRLIDAPEGSWLRVDLIDQAGAVLQFTAAPDRIQIDHPLVTPQQIEREDALRNTLFTLGLTPYETRGSDGSRFLDCEAPRDAERCAIVVRRILESVFRVDFSTRLRFVGDGLPPAARPSAGE